MAFLIFNKQFRAEEKVFSELRNKIKQSKKIEKIYSDDAEVYQLDTIDICMNVISYDLVVKDKAGNIIYSLNCNFKSYDEMQTVRSHNFSKLLEYARARKDKENESIEKQRKMKQAKDRLDAANKAEAKKREFEINAVEALKRMKGL